LSLVKESAMAHRITMAIVSFVVLLPIGAVAGPLHDAAKAGDVAQIKALLDQGADINENPGTATPLYFAINTQHADAAKLLIERGADVNARSTWGTPLHAAASKGMTEIATLLLDRGADPNALWNTLTPLHMAAKAGQLDVTRVLLDRGADINALTAADEPALHYAIGFRHADVADLLRERATPTPRAQTVDPLLATADVEHGFKIAVPCRGCHSVDRESKRNHGPPLWDIVGRRKASYVGFRYSEAMKALSGSWTYAELNDYLAHPAWTVPGIDMKMAGIHDLKDRADLIAYLRTLSDHPAPLP
jgi:cytochrome c